MKYLLDTHTLIWSIIEPTKLSAKVRQIIEDPEQHIMVSVLSFWEISLKFALKKLELMHIQPGDFPAICEEMNIETLPLDAEQCATYHKLTKFYHKDPFDRMLIWQAKSLNIPILSKDEQIKQYESEGISVIW